MFKSNGFQTEEIPIKESDSFNVMKIFGKLIRYWYVFLISAFLALIGAFIINRYSTPIYNIRTSALVQSANVNSAVSELLYGEELFGSKSVDLASEAYMLRSPSLIRETLTELNYGISYHSQGKVNAIELFPDSPITLEFDNQSTFIPYKMDLIVKQISDTSYSLEVDADLGIKRFFGEDTISHAFNNHYYVYDKIYNIKGFVFLFKKNKPIVAKEQIIVKVHNYNNLARAYRNNLSVVPIDPDSKILEISLESTHKDKGVNFLDKLVEIYIGMELMRKNETATNSIDFINNQILLMSDSLNTVEAKLEDFKKSNKQITLSSEGSNYLELGQQFDSEKNKILLNLKFLNELEIYIKANNIEDIVIPSSIGIEDPGLNRSIQELVQLQLQSSGLKSSNPLMASYSERMKLLKSSVLENIYSLKSSNQFALESINSRIGNLNSTLSSLPEAERKFINIQRSYDLSEKLYLFLMEKKAEAGIAKASNTVDYRVIDTAQASSGPISPKPMFNYAFGLAFGIGIPFAILLLIELLNNKIEEKEDILSGTSIPYLGMITRSGGKEKIVDVDNARSIVADSFRTIRSNLRYLSDQSERSHAFLITSSISGEGKSFCTANLSYVFSNFGKRVVLIDADLRKTQDYTEFDLDPAQFGLSDYLAGICGIDEILKPTKFPNLYLIASGEIPPNPSELLINGRFQILLEEMKKRFDYVFVDTPPIGILPDGLELMALCDMNIFVVRQNYSLKRFLKEIEETYRKVKVKNMAILFNGVSIKHKGYYNYYNSYYKHKKIPKVVKQIS